MSIVQRATRDRIALLTLDDPARRNALSLAMSDELRSLFGAIADDDGIGAVVLTGAGPAFSAGADLADLAQASRERLTRIYEGFLAVARCPVPTIAAVNGPAVGAGMNLALACDVRIAARSARFEARFLDLALHPGGGHTWMMRRLLGPQGALAVTVLGEPLDGDAAARSGLAWRAVDDDAVVDEALRLAARAAAAPRELVAEMKATLAAMATVGRHEEAVAIELEPQLRSTERPAFRERLAALQRRIGGGGPKMSHETVLVERDGPIATVRLNRPERMNAVVEDLYRDLQAALAGLEDDGTTRAIVLTGSPRVRDGVEKPAFCAGADLREHAAGTRGPAERRAYIELAHETVRRLLVFPRPVVAAVAGPARGAGTELALACDFIVMADETTIALPEVGLGTFVGGAATLLLPRLVGAARARELIYTGRVLDGRAAVAAGLALRSVPQARVADEARALATELAGQAPVSLAHAKRLLREAPALDVETVLRREADAILDCMETDDWREGVRAFAEKRPPRYEGR